MTNLDRFLNDFSKCKRLYSKEPEIHLAIAALYTAINHTEIDKTPTKNDIQKKITDYYFLKVIENQVLLAQIVQQEKYSIEQFNNTSILIDGLNYPPNYPSNLYISHLWAANLTPRHFYHQLILRTKRMHYWLYDTRLNYQNVEGYSLLYAAIHRNIAQVDLRRKYCQQLLVTNRPIDVTIVHQLSLLLPLLSNQLTLDIQKLFALISYLDKYELFDCENIEEWLIMAFLACSNLTVEQQIDRLLLTVSQLKYNDRFRKQAINSQVYFLFAAILVADYPTKKQVLKDKRRMQTAELIVLEALTQYCEHYLYDLPMNLKEKMNRRKIIDEIFIRS